MKQFFAKLDPRGTGYITPEAFSSFAEVSRCPDPDNICKYSATRGRTVHCTQVAQERLLTLPCFDGREEKSYPWRHVRERRHGRL